jgi:hypothetical protein
MSQMLALSDEACKTLTILANERGQSPEAFVEAMIAAAQAEAERDPYTNPRYYTTEEWFRHLGADDDMIREAMQLAEKDDDGDADA